MNVDSILTSDFATAAGGKLTVVGVFNTIRASALPIRLGTMFVSLVIHGHMSELGKSFPLEIVLLDQDRNEVLKAEAEFEFPEPRRSYPGLPLQKLAVFPLYGPEFKRAGPYAWEVYIDGTYHAGTVFYIEEPEE